MASKIKVDQIEGQSGSSIEIPTGHTLKVTDHGNNKIIATNSSGILSGVNIGSAGQSLVVNSSANGFEFNAISSDFARQIKYVQQSSSISFSSTTHSDTGLSLTFDNNLKSTSSIVKLSFFTVWGTTNNPDSVRVRYRDANGSEISAVGSGANDHMGGNENTSSAYQNLLASVCMATVSSTTPIAYRPFIRRLNNNGHGGYLGRDYDDSHSFPILFMIEEYAL